MKFRGQEVQGRLLDALMKSVTARLTRDLGALRRLMERIGVAIDPKWVEVKLASLREEIALALANDPGDYDTWRDVVSRATEIASAVLQAEAAQLPKPSGEEGSGLDTAEGEREAEVTVPKDDALRSIRATLSAHGLSDEEIDALVRPFAEGLPEEVSEVELRAVWSEIRSKLTGEYRPSSPDNWRRFAESAAWQIAQELVEGYDQLWGMRPTPADVSRAVERAVERVLASGELRAKGPAEVANAIQEMLRSELDLEFRRWLRRQTASEFASRLREEVNRLWDEAVDRIVLAASSVGLPMSELEERLAPIRRRLEEALDRAVSEIPASRPSASVEELVALGLSRVWSSGIQAELHAILSEISQREPVIRVTPSGIAAYGQRAIDEVVSKLRPEVVSAFGATRAMELMGRLRQLAYEELVGMTGTVIDASTEEDAYRRAAEQAVAKAWERLRAELGEAGAAEGGEG